jgi:hypothetical protein
MIGCKASSIVCILLGQVVLCTCYISCLNIKSRTFEPTTQPFRIFAKTKDCDAPPMQPIVHTSRRKFFQQSVLGRSATILAIWDVLTPLVASAAPNGSQISESSNGLMQQPKSKRIGGLASKIRGITVVMVGFIRMEVLMSSFRQKITFISNNLFILPQLKLPTG